jgi:hypothetical protein
MFGCKESQRLNQADGPLQLAAADVIGTASREMLRF